MAIFTFGHKGFFYSETEVNAYAEFLGFFHDCDGAISFFILKKKKHSSTFS